MDNARPHVPPELVAVLARSTRRAGTIADGLPMSNQLKRVLRDATDSVRTVRLSGQLMTRAIPIEIWIQVRNFIVT